MKYAKWIEMGLNDARLSIKAKEYREALVIIESMIRRLTNP
jgi:hypothetical protein